MLILLIFGKREFCIAKNLMDSAFAPLLYLKATYYLTFVLNFWKTKKVL